MDLLMDKYFYCLMSKIKPFSSLFNWKAIKIPSNKTSATYKVTHVAHITNIYDLSTRVWGILSNLFELSTLESDYVCWSSDLMLKVAPAGPWNADNTKANIPISDSRPDHINKSPADIATNGQHSQEAQ